MNKVQAFPTPCQDPSRVPYFTLDAFLQAHCSCSSIASHHVDLVLCYGGAISVREAIAVFLWRILQTGWILLIISIQAMWKEIEISDYPSYPESRWLTPQNITRPH